MQTPVEIDFQGMKATDALRASILDHLAALEKRFGRMTACRVAVKAPSEHHRNGGLYEVTIHLLLPQGREVEIARTPQADERHADVDFAVNDAFKRARRRLRDQLRRMRGEVKAHDGQPIGTVKRLDDGFGFLETTDGRDIYFHRNSVVNDAFAQLTPGSRVIYCEAPGEKGPTGEHGEAARKTRPALRPPRRRCDARSLCYVIAVSSSVISHSGAPQNRRTRNPARPLPMDLRTAVRSPCFVLLRPVVCLDLARVRSYQRP